MATFSLGPGDDNFPADSSAGADVIYGEDGSDTIQGGDESDLVYGGNGDDSLFGDDTAGAGFGDDTIFGGAGNDRLFGGNGNDLVYGGDDDDLVAPGEGGDSVYLGPGSDTVTGSLAELTGDTIFDFDFDTTAGGGGRIVVAGDQGDRIFLMDSDSLALDGDTIGDLRVVGGQGLTWQSEYDSVAGHTVFRLFDAVLFTEAADTVDLGSLSLENYDNVSDALDGNDLVTLSATSTLDDTFTGGNGDDTIFGSTDNGFESILGGEGDDLLYGGNSLGVDGLDTLDGANGNDTLFGEGGSETLVGGNGQDLMYGAGPDDDIFGEVGFNVLLATGGEGDDTIFGSASSDNVRGGNGLDLIYGGQGFDVLGGNGGSDTILGGAMADSIAGGDGDDLVLGGQGNDTLLVGPGSDTVRGSLDELTSDTVLDFATADGGDLDAIVVETVFGDDTRDVFAATSDLLDLDGDGDGDLVVTGSAGLDWRRTEIDGVTRFTIAQPLFTEDADTVDLGPLDLSEYGNVSDALGGSDRVTLTGASDRDDRFAGGEGDDAVVGSDDDETIGGGAGNDTIWGGDGQDAMAPGAGVDLVYGGDGGDMIGADTVGDLDQDTVADFLPGAVAESDYIDVQGDYGALDGTKLTGGVLDFGGGSEMMLAFAGQPLTGTVSATFADGWTQIRILGPTTTSNGGDLVVSDDKSNSIDGKNGDDTLYGGDGKDSLKGGNGNDSAHGGSDNDALWGGNGNDTLTGGNGTDSLYGENGNDSLLGGDGADRLEGGAGTDAVAGGAGADTLYGGAGADTITAGEGGDRVFGDADGDFVDLGEETAARDTVAGSVAHLSGDTIVGFDTGKGATADVLAITGLASKYGKLLDSVAIVDGVLSLSKVGGGEILFEDLAGDTWHTDTVLGADGSILIYVV